MVIYFGKKSIISGKNDSQNKRLAARIVIHSLLKTPTTSAFLMDFVIFHTTLVPPFREKVQLVGENSSDAISFMKHDIAKASVQLCKTLR